MIIAPIGLLSIDFLYFFKNLSNIYLSYELKTREMKYIDFYRKSAIIAPIFADMAELADALDLGSNIF